MLGLFTVGFGAIIGVGWIVSAGEWIDMAGGAVPVVAAFAVSALILLPVTRAYGEVMAAFPEADGEIQATTLAYGRKWAFAGGWFFALAYVMMCPWELIAIGQLLEALFPVFRDYPIYEIQGYIICGPTLAASLLTGVCLICINFRGVDLAVKFQKKLIGVLLMIVISAGILSFFKGDIRNVLPVTAETAGNRSGGFLNGFLTILAITPFYFSGFDTIPQMISGYKDTLAGKTVGRILSFSVISASVFYILVILSAAMILPWREITTLALPSAEVYEKGLDMTWFTKLMILGGLCGTISCLNSFLMASSKMLHSLGKEGMIPGIFQKTCSRYGTPTAAIVLTGVISLAGCFLGKSMMRPLINVCSFGFVFKWFQTALNADRFRKRHYGLTKPCQSSAGMIRTAVVFSAAMLGLLVIPGSPGALKWPAEIMIIIIWSVMGICFYYLMEKRTSRNC